jgi:SPP1 family predicted phage head-tail adaptor
MDAGQLDRRIELQRATTSDDGYTTEVTGWTTLADVWAKLVPISGAEMLAAGEQGAFDKVRLKIRRDSLWSDLNATDRLLFDDKAYNIVSVRQEGRGFYLIDAVARGDQN